MRKYSSRPDAENPEWTEEDFRRARPISEFPELVEAMLRYRGQRGKQKAPTKELISLRVDRDVVEAYRATGRGWQARANEALRAYSKQGGLRKAEPAKGRKRAATSAVSKRRVS
jgi:uncharacterized protein (DUF4415 family)